MLYRAKEIGRNVLHYDTHLEMCSNRTVCIENCKKIQEYNDIRIVVQTGELVLEVWGDQLKADIRTPECLMIHGRIQSITFTPKGTK